MSRACCALGVLVAVLCGPLAAAATEEHRYDHDPVESVNRSIFWFNDQVDVRVLEPAARGWNRITPNAVQTSLSDFFLNLGAPLAAVNNLLQGKPAASASDIARFTINTGIGFLGFLDPASALGIERHTEDFGQTLGRWGVPSGPYLVIPFLGPSNPRDFAGTFFDYPLAIVGLFVPQYIVIGPRLVDIVNTRARFLDEVSKAKEASLDYYVFARNAYTQSREALIDDRTEVARESEEELYYWEDETE